MRDVQMKRGGGGDRHRKQGWIVELFEKGLLQLRVFCRQKEVALETQRRLQGASVSPLIEPR